MMVALQAMSEVKPSLFLVPMPNELFTDVSLSLDPEN